MLLSVVLFSWFLPRPVSALISFTKGNTPVRNIGWPTGTEEVANLSSRLGHMQGPFVNADYFVYRCNDTDEFNAALEKFSAIRVPRTTKPTAVPDGSADIIDDKPLLLVVHDYLETIVNQAPWAVQDGKYDWAFSVWAPENFHRNFNRPMGTGVSNHSYFRQFVPPPQIDVYVGGDGSIVWEEVNVPSNVRVIDKRAAAAPVDVKTGGVIRGRIFDMATHQVIAGADVALMKRVKPRGMEETVRAKSDDDGAFSMQGIPEGYYEIHVAAEGYAGRNAGTYDNRAGHSLLDFDVLLSGTDSLRGVVVGTDGNPIRGVEVKARGIWGMDGLVYKCSQEATATTDKDGRFELHALPRGYIALRCHAPSMHQKSISPDISSVGTNPWETPEEVIIILEGTGIVRGRVVGEDGKPLQRSFSVSIKPKGGVRIGTWSGSRQCEEDGGFEFKGVPPGEYVVIAMPNPGREGESSEPKVAEVDEGKTVSIEFASPFVHDER